MDPEKTCHSPQQPQKRQACHALHTRVDNSKIPGAGLGLFMQETAKKNERVAIYSGDLLTKEEADRSGSKYIMQVGPYYLDGEKTHHAAGRYINYAPSAEANARIRARSKPIWDDKKKRWWVSIKATKTILPTQEIKMPYGQAYKGLSYIKKKPKPAMMQVPGRSTTREESKSQETGAWKRAYGRTMKRLANMAQQWRRTTKNLQSTIMLTAKRLMTWYRDTDESVMNEVEVEVDTDPNTDTTTSMNGKGGAVRVQFHTQSSVVGGSTPPTSNIVHDIQNNNEKETRDRVSEPRVTWKTSDGCITPKRHKSTRTHYPHTKGRSVRRREVRPYARSLRLDWVVSQAKKRAKKRAERRQRQSQTWKTIT